MKHFSFFSLLTLCLILSANAAFAQSWNLTGNAAAATNFLGTTNTTPLVVKTNNAERFRIMTSGPSTLLMGATTGFYDANGNAGSIKLQMDLQQNTATTYGANYGLHSINSTNGTTTKGSSEGFVGIASTWSAGGSLGGVYGVSKIDKITAAAGNSAGYGGYFATVLNSGAALSTSGTNRIVVAGVGGDLSGAAPATVPANTVIAALYGNDAINNSNTWGLYVNGRSRTTLSVWSSDRRFKKNIETIGSALSMVSKLRGVQYEFDQAKFPERAFPQGKTDGFIAQELREVMPELVVEENDGYLAVNYVGIIPVLTEAVKELKNEKDAAVRALETELAEKDQQILALEKRMAAIEAMLNKVPAERAELPATKIMSANTLLCHPNPTTGATTVDCQLPENTFNAELVVRDQRGREMQRQAVTQRGACSIRLDLSSFPSGVYFCNIVADGQSFGAAKVVVGGK